MPEDWEKQWNRAWSNIPLWWLILWRGYRSLLKAADLRSPRIIELGCGSGRTSLALAKLLRGSVTLVDNSEAAMVKAKRIFRDQGVRVKFIMRDLFSIEATEKYDIVHSEGLIEHFDQERLNKLVGLHRELVRDGGYVIIFVPTPSRTYRVWRFLQERMGMWYYGDEHPIKLEKLKYLCHLNGLRVLRTANTPFQVGVLCQVKRN